MDLPDSLQEQKKRDHEIYFVEEGEPGFNPAHNKHVIASTIKKTNQMRALRNRQYEDNVRERVDAVMTYAKSRLVYGSTPVEKYFGKRQLAHLRGQQIVDIIKSKIAGRQGNVYLPQ